MKRLLTVFFALVFLFVFVSCQQAQDVAPAITASPALSMIPQATPAPTDAPAAQLPNPIVEVEGSADFYDLGFIITPHQMADTVDYSIINNTIAQIIFTLDGDTFTYRAAITTEEIAGVYATFDPLPQSLDLEGPGFKVSVLIRTINGGQGGALAEWAYEDVRYSFYTADPTDYEALTDVLLPIIYYDLPFAACCG